MQLTKFEVDGLFGTLKHTIDLGLKDRKVLGPSLIILYGRNGVGKTTILRMIDGLLRLDFDVFRQMPCKSCLLQFDTGAQIRVTPDLTDSLNYLLVEYKDLFVKLHPKQSGPVTPEGVAQVENFRNTFFMDTEDINFEFVDTARIAGILYHQELFEQFLEREELNVSDIRLFRRIRRTNPKAKLAEPLVDLAAKVRKFISDAQVNYRRYFATTDPDLFPKILKRLTETQTAAVDPQNILSRLDKIREIDKISVSYGLSPDQWDYDELATFVNERASGPGAGYAFAALNAYLEALESRSAERQLLTNRLGKFEKLMSTFLHDKKVIIEPKKGLKIETSSGKDLSANQLSSGEYHLLYLMVSALVTTHKGTVIAIDEPEMSMHIKWQRKLIRALMECASDAEPQFIFATHSPDIAAEYKDYLVKLDESE